MKRIYRYTDWENECNDFIGTYKQCEKVFDKAVKENPELRCSIYDITEDNNEEGVLFNENCPEYQDYHDICAEEKADKEVSLK